MSLHRGQRFFTSLAVSCASMAANLLFTLLSVPLALSYLSKEEFGLWALAVQIGGFLLLLDFGMSSSLARFLANHKDSKEDPSYGNILQTGKVILGLQALLVGLLAFLGGFFLHGWLELPANLVPPFQRLVWIQGAILALGLALRPYASPLWAHQRLDITHWATVANLLTALLVMWAGFVFGLGVDSFWLSSLCGAIWTWFVPWIACSRLGLFPAPPARGFFQKNLFCRMFTFGRDILLMQLGGLLCSGSQIILITKLLGLESAAVFSIVTKTLTMGQLLIAKILENAAPGLTELFVHGERERLALRFYQMVTVSLGFATVAGLALMAGNRIFVLFWTQGKVEWSFVGDALLGAILICSVSSRCFQGAFGISGELARVRFLPLLEGALFIMGSLILAKNGGLGGILAITLASNFLVSFLGGGLQILHLSRGKLSELKLGLQLLSLYLLAACISGWLFRFLESPLARIASIVSLMLIFLVFLFQKVLPILREKP